MVVCPNSRMPSESFGISSGFLFLDPGLPYILEKGFDGEFITNRESSVITGLLPLGMETCCAFFRFGVPPG